MSVSRQVRRALSRQAATKFVRKKFGELPREERHALELDLAARTFRETPAHMFEKHVIQRPRIIVPQVEVETPERIERLARQNDSKGKSGIILTDA
jgi:aryl-alcohol dehydrogenase-like predicted oxidoreductase